VLIVDDDPAIVRVYEEVLRHAGFEVRGVATTGREALEADPVDIILLDHHLPDGEGLDLLGPLRNQTEQPSIIMVTGAGDEHLAASALRRGAEDYLVKDGSLIELLPQILERVRRTRALRQALDAAEQDLVHVERRTAVGEMTVTLKHEINNPLMSAFTEAELLLGDPSLDDTRRRSIQSIHEALGRIRDTLRRAEGLDQVQSRKYLEGIDMVDLDADAPETAPVPRGEAAVWITDEDLARIASWASSSRTTGRSTGPRSTWA
jgi:response regulator of citrate/malate metabolism